MVTIRMKKMGITFNLSPQRCTFDCHNGFIIAMAQLLSLWLHIKLKYVKFYK
jgi:hypothetical protein